jgi:uncharacterized tellurite resistance protein B-like protein
MEKDKKILEGHSDLEKGAYLGALATIATADREATEEEIAYIEALCNAADLSPDQRSLVVQAATHLQGEELHRCLDVLKNSQLKYSLVTDMIAFAKSDEEYVEEEQEAVRRVADYLGVDQQQFSLLDRFVEKANGTEATPEQATQPSFLSSLGMKDEFDKAGIGGSSFLKGLLGVAAPLILTGMLTGGMRRRRYGGGMFGGGMMGGGMLGGGMMGGGLGSLIGMLGGRSRFRF